MHSRKTGGTIHTTAALHWTAIDTAEETGQKGEVEEWSCALGSVLIALILIKVMVGLSVYD